MMTPQMRTDEVLTVGSSNHGRGNTAQHGNACRNCQQEAQHHENVVDVQHNAVDLPIPVAQHLQHGDAALVFLDQHVDNQVNRDDTHQTTHEHHAIDKGTECRHRIFKGIQHGFVIAQI